VRRGAPQAARRRGRVAPSRLATPQQCGPLGRRPCSRWRSPVTPSPGWRMNG